MTASCPSLGHGRGTRGARRGPISQLADRIQLLDPDQADQALAAVFGADWAAHNWHPHFRTWRTRRLLALERTHGDQLDEIAEFLASFAAELKAVGPSAYLQSKAHRAGEDVLPAKAFVPVLVERRVVRRLARRCA